MPASHAHASATHQALYQGILEEAAAGGGALMGKMVAATAVTLRNRELAARDLRARDALAESITLLHSKQRDLESLYPQVLRAAFQQSGQKKKEAPQPVVAVNFDQLELMDETQVQESVAMARAQQSVMLAADASLTELNTLMCGVLGLKSVRPDSNPLRPEVYVNALKEVVEQIPVASAVRMDWLGTMGQALGQELRALYLYFCDRLRQDGVQAVGYVVLQTPSSGAVGAGQTPTLDDDAGATQPMLPVSEPAPIGALSQSRPNPLSQAPEQAARAHGSDESLLTLDKLRRLLAGELEQYERSNPSMQAFARRFAREFEGQSEHGESAESDYTSTVPAAFEALTELKQADHVVQQLEQRQGRSHASAAADNSAVAAERQAMRRNAKDVVQALSLEVVTLMVDNMARNPRLLEPVQQLIKRLEPALMRLVLADPRFFTDKQHPARLLLQDMTHRSLAYPSVQASGFSDFLQGLEHAVDGLAVARIESAEPFERVLSELNALWSQTAQARAGERAQAVAALQQAEQRNLLAEKIAREIDGHPQASQVPASVIDFLCGPWAQVVAQARLNGGSGSSAADKYQALISALLWSTHPGLTRREIPKLTRLVPRLLGTLREGLETIQYPSTKTSAFLEVLMGLHQLAFRAASIPAEDLPPPQLEVSLQVHGRQVEDGNPWVAPEEAKSSNFMDLPDSSETPMADPELVQPTVPAAALAADGAAIETADGEVPLGSWVELLVGGQWVRTQLTWASPHGTLFLFTSALGATQSMTRRSRDKLLSAGSLRIVSGQPVVDGALDAVARIAMRNSLDSTY